MPKHISVLLNEAISELNIKEDGVYVDATLGYGGHSSEILKKVERGYLFAFDQDSEAYSPLIKIVKQFGIVLID